MDEQADSTLPFTFPHYLLDINKSTKPISGDLQQPHESQTFECVNNFNKVWVDEYGQCQKTTSNTHFHRRDYGHTSHSLPIVMTRSEILAVLRLRTVEHSNQLYEPKGSSTTAKEQQHKPRPKTLFKSLLGTSNNTKTTYLTPLDKAERDVFNCNVNYRITRTYPNGQSKTFLVKDVLPTTFRSRWVLDHPEDNVDYQT